MSITVIKSTDNLTVEQMYFLTLNPSVEKLSDKAGEIIDIDAWCLYDDISSDKNGNEKTSTILAIKTPDNKVFGTNSATFIKSFTDMIDFFKKHGNVDVTRILVDGGTSKSGRNFIQCVYAPSNS
ncbi:MAG: hypothetical protein J6S85_12830 [Methanobrevibacter sp.]|nr:hypothetical protein [Methanobrevibacter sp.]